MAEVQMPHGPLARFDFMPFPAMVTPRREGRALQEFLHRTIGRERTDVAHAAIPFSREDFALFLDRVPGTHTYSHPFGHIR